MVRDLYTLICEIIIDWLKYKQIGHAQPDDPNQKDYPIIRGAQDASAQWQIDRSKSTLKIKKKK